MSKQNFAEWIAEDLKKSGLNAEIVEEMGVSEIHGREDLKKILGFSSIDGQAIPQMSESYAIQYPDGYTRIKLRYPLETKNGVAKYLSPTKTVCSEPFHLYYLPSEAEHLRQKEYSLCITEGEKKGAKLTQEARKLEKKVTVVAIPGITMWYKDELWGFDQDFHKMDEVSVYKGRKIFIFLDADFQEKEAVRTQIVKQWLYWHKKGAIPFVAIWPLANGKGIDDYLANMESQGKDPTVELEKLMANAMEHPFTIAIDARHLAKCFIQLDYKIRTEVKELWDKYKLGKILGVNWGTFKNFLMEALRLQGVSGEENQNDTGVFEKDGKTWALKKDKDGETVTIEVANFNIAILKQIKNQDGDASFLVRLSSEFDTEEFEIEGNCFSTPQIFRDTISRKGNFFYNVSDIALHNQFRTFILKKAPIPRFRKTPFLGMVEDGFLLHNGIVKRNGDFVPIEDSSLIPPAPKAGKKMEMKSAIDPKLFLQEMLQNLMNISGKQTWKIIGFVVATLFLDKIVDAFSHFPVLFLYGKHQTGKSCVAKWIQSCFGCLKAIGESAFGTPTAWNRLMTKFRNCPVILNEFKSSEQSNLMVCQIHDREGKRRGKKDQGVETDELEINSSAIIVSTQHIVGGKAEDAQSRIVEVESGEFAYNQESFAWLEEHKEEFTTMLPFLLKNMPQDFVQEIKENIRQLRSQQESEERILENHAILSTCYNLFVDFIGKQESQYVGQETVSEAVEKQEENTKESDLGNTFLTVALSLVRNQEVNESLARIVQNQDGEETMIFSLKELLPHVKAKGRMAEIGISDFRTIGSALKDLGCTKKSCRELGSKKNVWYWNVDGNV